VSRSSVPFAGAGRSAQPDQPPQPDRSSHGAGHPGGAGRPPHGAGQPVSEPAADSRPPLADTLRSRGRRLTAQRQLVLEAVYRLGHATPDQVHAEVSRTAAGINITTVYRSLELLEELGLVTHAHLSHGAPTYHGVTEEQHVHLVCRACGGVDDVSADLLNSLAQTLEREKSFLVDMGHVALFGVCGGCGNGGELAHGSVEGETQ
jgi:Fur family ferric uptake transcriptional regulator